MLSTRRANTRKRHPLDCRKRVPPTTRHLREHYPSALGTEHGVMCSRSQTREIPPGLRCRCVMSPSGRGGCMTISAARAGGHATGTGTDGTGKPALNMSRHMIISPRSRPATSPPAVISPHNISKDSAHHHVSLHDRPRYVMPEHKAAKIPKGK